MSEKRKKSWREIDQQRDKSQHRSDAPKPAGQGRRGGDPSRSHRAALDHLFETGKVSELVRKRDEATGTVAESGPSRRAHAQAIAEASNRAEKIAAIDAYLEAFSLPQDFDTLSLVLEHPDDEVVEQALDRIEARLQEEKPRRPRTLIAQLKSVAELSEWGRLRRRATAILERL